MNHSSDSLILVGSSSERAIIIYRFKSDALIWEKIKVVKNDLPSLMLYIPSQKGLFVGSDHGVERGGRLKVQQSLTSYNVSPKADPILSFKSKRFTDKSNLLHLCLDPNQPIVYGIHSDNVSSFSICTTSSIGVPRDRNWICQAVSINSCIKLEKAFISLSVKNIAAFYEVYNVTSAKKQSDERFFIKFKSEDAMDKLRLCGSSFENYFTLIVALSRSCIYTYKNINGVFEAKSFIITYPVNANSRDSSISDVIAPQDLPFIFVSNCEHRSIATCKLYEDKLVLAQLYEMNCRQMPKRLYYNGEKECLYVTTKDSIVILRVNIVNGQLHFFQEIPQVPGPTCLVAI